MKFKIKHQSDLYRRGMWLSLGGLVLLAVIAAWLVTIMNDTMKFIAIIIALVGMGIWLIFAILHSIELAFGTKIIFRDDCVKIKKLLRHRTIPYNEIVDLEYSHYEKRERRSHMILRDHTPTYRKYCDTLRSRLIITTFTGKPIELNDKAVNYYKNQKAGLDPETDVVLYAVYREMKRVK